MLDYGNAPSAVPNVHILLVGVQTGALDLLADGLEALTLAAYVIGALALRRRGKRWSAGSTTAFFAGMTVIWIAVGSGLAAYDDVNVTLHVIQHILLMMVAAPLLAIGRPITLAAQASPRGAQRRVVALANSRTFAALAQPAVAATLYFGAMFGYFLTPLYPYSVDHPLVHDATHLIFLLVGYVYWQPMVGGDPVRRRLSHPARTIALMAGMPAEAFLGLLIALWPRPLSSINTIANTHFAGQMFLAGAMLVTGSWIAYVLLDWWRRSERSAPRDERRVEAAQAATRAYIERHGLSGVPAGWTIPPWELERLEAEFTSQTDQ